MAVTLGAGDTAPDFDLEDQDGKRHRLADYAGQTVVLYFSRNAVLSFSGSRIPTTPYFEIIENMFPFTAV